jgi:hypothetical protein
LFGDLILADFLGGVCRVLYLQKKSRTVVGEGRHPRLPPSPVIPAKAGIFFVETFGLNA